MHAPGLTLGILVGIAGGLACTLDLEPRISCGDAYADHEAGEECDPRDPSSFEEACLGTAFPHGVPQCDPVTCEILNDEEQCCDCGDGVVSPDCGEECDGDNLNGNVCAGGAASVQCTLDCKLDYSECPPCGNGVVEDTEECDVNVDPGTVGNPVSCDTLDSPYHDLRPYTFGTTIDCEADCRYNRLGCSYCGDNQLDVEPVLVAQPDSKTLPEWCDGDKFDPAKLAAEFGNQCASLELDLRRNVGCAENCLGFVERPGEPCCRVEFELCPADGETPRCCAEYDDPEADPCTLQIDTMGGQKYVCR